MTASIPGNVAASARALIDWEQRDVAKAVGISRNTLSAFENGRSTLTSENMQNLISFYHTQNISFVHGPTYGVLYTPERG